MAKKKWQAHFIRHRQEKTVVCSSVQEALHFLDSGLRERTLWPVGIIKPDDSEAAYPCDKLRGKK